MNRHVAEAVGILGSYGCSALTFINDINFLGTITALAGSILTLALALETYQRAHGLWLDNKIKQREFLKHGKN